MMEAFSYLFLALRIESKWVQTVRHGIAYEGYPVKYQWRFWFTCRKLLADEVDNNQKKHEQE